MDFALSTPIQLVSFSENQNFFNLPQINASVNASDNASYYASHYAGICASDNASVQPAKTPKERRKHTPACDWMAKKTAPQNGSWRLRSTNVRE